MVATTAVVGGCVLIPPNAFAVPCLPPFSPGRSPPTSSSPVPAVSWQLNLGSGTRNGGLHRSLTALPGSCTTCRSSPPRPSETRGELRDPRGLVTLHHEGSKTDRVQRGCVPTARAYTPARARRTALPAPPPPHRAPLGFGTHLIGLRGG